MPVRGIRGAISVAEDSADEILGCTRSLIVAIQRANPSLKPEDITTAWFTATTDLVSIAPARAARDLLGWTLVPLMCVSEMPVSGSLPRIIRVLIQWNTELPQTAVHHVYMGTAVALRPDLVE